MQVPRPQSRWAGGGLWIVTEPCQSSSSKDSPSTSNDNQTALTEDMQIIENFQVAIDAAWLASAAGGTGGKPGAAAYRERS